MSCITTLLELPLIVGISWEPHNGKGANFTECGDTLRRSEVAVADLRVRRVDDF